MTTDKAPDFAGIAYQLAQKALHPVYSGSVMFPDSREKERRAYASCMEARLRSDWETIRLLRASDHIASCAIYDPVPLVPKDCDCGLSAHLSKLLEPFTP